MYFRGQGTQGLISIWRPEVAPLRTQFRTSQSRYGLLNPLSIGVLTSRMVLRDWIMPASEVAKRRFWRFFDVVRKNEWAKYVDDIVLRDRNGDRLLIHCKSTRLFAPDSFLPGWLESAPAQDWSHIVVSQGPPHSQNKIRRELSARAVRAILGTVAEEIEALEGADSIEAVPRFPSHYACPESVFACAMAPSREFRVSAWFGPIDARMGLKFRRPYWNLASFARPFGSGR